MVDAQQKIATVSGEDDYSNEGSRSVISIKIILSLGPNTAVLS